MSTRVFSVIPIGEFILFLSLLRLNHLSIFNKVNKINTFKFFYLWLFYNILLIVIGSLQFGYIAFRDGSHVIDALFLFLGFNYFSSTYSNKLFSKWLYGTLVIAFFYSFLFLIKDFLIPFSPIASGLSGNQIPILFNFTNSSFILLLFISYMLFKNGLSKNFSFFKFFVIGISLAYILLIFNSRLSYLQILSLFFISIFLGKNYYLQFIFLLLIAFLFIQLNTLFDINFVGRHHIAYSTDLIFEHFITIFGIDSSILSGQAEGLFQRIHWWQNIFIKLTSSLTNLLFGLGYGEPLIDFIIKGDVIVREPHNSFISILARGGIISFLLWIIFHIFLIKSWIITYRTYKDIDKNTQVNLLVVLSYFIFMWIGALGSDVFEKPFYAAPYYFFWGYVLRLYFNKKNRNI